MATPRYLTKSRFKLAVECPTKLFYTGKRDIYKDVMAENEFLAMLAEGGYQVGELAKYLYPDGIEINSKNHAEAEAITNEQLKKETVVLFEPAIRVNNFFVRIDILVKHGNYFELIEVKAKSYDPLKPNMRGARGGISSGMLPYLQDVAFQKWVLQQAHPKSEIKTFLMMPDKSKLSPADGVNQMFKYSRTKGIISRIPDGLDIKGLAGHLLEKVSADEFTEEILNSDLKYPSGKKPLSEVAQEWASAYLNDTKIPPKIGKQCGKCQFKTSLNDKTQSGFHECWKEANNWTDKDFEKGTVLDLWFCQRKEKFIDQGLLKLSQITPEDLTKDSEDSMIDGLSRSQRQVLQLGDIPADFDQGGFFFNSTLFKNEMANWEYPYHMIDFETASVALPFHDGMRPYEAVAFQFSHHIMEKNGSVSHAGEFICVEPGVFPNYSFARALKKELENDNGTTFMWSPHENTILKTIARQIAEDPHAPADADELKAFILSITKDGDREMYDLCRLAEKTFFHPDTKASTSIKKVLPAMLKISQKLKEIYSQPTYGAPNGIKSINFSSKDGFRWLGHDGQGDPYTVLKQYAKDAMPDGLEDSDEGETSIIAEGGAAATAYSRLQFEDLDNEARARITSALLRYCELDTLAMVMIMQGWQDI
jgi:Domain of unknown function(DUF2779)